MMSMTVIWIFEYPVYPVQAVSDLSLTWYSPVKAESALTGSDSLPSKGLKWPENGQLFLTALYFRQIFTYCFDKKDWILKIYKKMVAQKSNIGHLENPLDIRLQSF
jgi:hypothetical protein